MSAHGGEERFETVVIGGGQAGLSVGYHLARRQRRFVILDAGAAIGDAWRQRWDSLRLFTPAGFSSLDGMPFPAHRHAFPTKDEMADYLEAYADKFDLPVRLGVRVQRVFRESDGFVVESARTRLRADNVVVAMGTYQRPRIPDFAGGLDPAIRQLHSAEYRNPGQLRDGKVLLVGAGNSASEIAMELTHHGHPVALAGRSTGAIPFRIEGWFGRYLGVRLVTRGLFRHVLTVRTPMGRALRRKVLGHGGPLIRVKPRDLRRAGVERLPRVVGIQDGAPALEDGRVVDGVANVIWCTGYRTAFDWIDLPVHGDREPLHESGIVPTEPGLYFVGLFFLDSLASDMIQGVGRDAERVVRHLTARRELEPPPVPTTGAGTSA